MSPLEDRALTLHDIAAAMPCECRETSQLDPEHWDIDPCLPCLVVGMLSDVVPARVVAA